MKHFTWLICQPLSTEPPDRVSITFLNHSESLFEGDRYTLQCHVTEVAPAENVLVTFYRGEKMLAQMHSNTSSEKKPVTQSFTLNIVSSKEDTEAQYWCEAKLELGPEGPQHLPVMASQRLCKWNQWSALRVFGIYVDSVFLISPLVLFPLSTSLGSLFAFSVRPKGWMQAICFKHCSIHLKHVHFELQFCHLELSQHHWTTTYPGYV